MEKVYFKNEYEGNTPIPKAMWWYICENFDKNTHVNADICNKLLNNELKDFFEKYPKELTNTCVFITQEDINFYKSEINIKEK